MAERIRAYEQFLGPEHSLRKSTERGSLIFSIVL
jgi:hypothetical protein